MTLRPAAFSTLITLSSAGLLAACGGLLPTPDAGGGDGTCSSDSSCKTSEVCHPVAKVCVAKCNSTSDCPSASLSCAALSGTSAKVCQCSSDGMCGLTEVCQPYSLCTAKCTSTSCPSGYTCDSASGKCATPSAPCGFGADAGTCATGKLCNYAAGMCEAAGSCSSSSPQPDTCRYSQQCSGSTCASAVSRPACSNFNTTGGTMASFNPATSSGPIIYAVRAPSPAVPTSVCLKGLQGLSWQLDLYRTDTDFPAQLTALGGIWYVRSDGVKSDLTAGLPASYYTANGKNASLRVYICGNVTATTVAGYYLTDGNEVCADNGTLFSGSTNCTNDPQCGPGKTCTVATGTCT